MTETIDIEKLKDLTEKVKTNEEQMVYVRGEDWNFFTETLTKQEMELAKLRSIITTMYSEIKNASERVKRLEAKLGATLDYDTHIER